MTLKKHAPAYSIIAFAVADLVQVHASTVQPETKFVADLGFDSLDSVELMMYLEEEFGVEISDEAAAKLSTPADIVAWLEATGFNFDDLRTTCDYCGATVEQPCDDVPVDLCETALDATSEAPAAEQPVSTESTAAPAGKQDDVYAAFVGQFADAKGTV